MSISMMELIFYIQIKSIVKKLLSNVKYNVAYVMNCKAYYYIKCVHDYIVKLRKLTLFVRIMIFLAITAHPTSTINGRECTISLTLKIP